MESISGMMFYNDAKSILFNDAKLTDSDCFHKVPKMDEAHLSVIADGLKLGDIVVEIGRHDLDINKIAIVLEHICNDGNVKKTITEISMDKLMSCDMPIPNQELFYIIKDYLNGILFLTDDLLKKINNMYFEYGLRSYILIPILIYILKDIIKEV
jgi:hypothetical protein